MKTLARERDKAEIVQRLGEVRPQSVRRWGRMSAHQMVCHLNDSLRVATGEMHASDATGLLQRTIVKWIVLYLPLAWPTGVVTRPEIDQELGGTRPGDFPTDRAQLKSLLERITVRTGTLRAGNSAWPSHPIFGRMSEADWLRWAYLHTDHHLRQFGA